jgi:hypoxanthine-guanine phosphoribosyltransferase/biotin operon repressor
MKTVDKIIEYIQEHGQASGVELSRFLEITDRAVRKQISNLLEKNIVIKQGKSPKVFYSLVKNNPTSVTGHSVGLSTIKKEHADIINNTFLLISPVGERMNGVPAFIEWCKKRKFDVTSRALEYVDILHKLSSFRKNGLIEGIQKINKTFKEIFLDEVLYVDFYSIEVFGKTKLGQMILYAKQSQNKKMIKEVAMEVKDMIAVCLKQYKIDAVAFTPPSVKREVQFMKELERNLDIPLPNVSVIKIKTEITVPQKTLSKLEDRIENAERTMIVNEKRKFNTVLILDDALGSGATMNAIAKKMKAQGVAKRVIGLALTGSFSGFDVISEI